MPLPADTPLLCCAAQAILALLLAMRMTMFRVEVMKEGEEKVTSSVSYQKWSKAQVNSAEYHGLFMAMYAVLYAASTGRGKQMRALTGYGCMAGVASSALFAAGVITGPIQGANPAKGESPPPIRAVGALGRYASLAVLAFEATKYRSKL
eukprot:gnl/TRDRNA2_/TRDRNA2_44991_c0_seq1.p1 gnl/TRDRNA2_/TRDRNA2_44991_c0~~gnl/TRDRNA2_/TRDRNA2_44991_c0_seq1.p1  ORF type:complete len:150 (+),score=29.02 gnl/TRDRNA2_/TRDRNA2_44991_c0_seq1:84-533(+)